MWEKKCNYLQIIFVTSFLFCISDLWPKKKKNWIKGTKFFFQFILMKMCNVLCLWYKTTPFWDFFLMYFFFFLLEQYMIVHQNVILKIPIKGTTRLYNRLNFSSVSLLSVIRWPCWDYITCCVHCCLLTIVNQLWHVNK